MNEFPKMVYSRSGLEPKIVRSREEQEELGAEYSEDRSLYRVEGDAPAAEAKPKKKG